MALSDMFIQKSRLLFVVSAPSGTGKTSLCREAVRQVPHLGFSVSHTTRPSRQGEDHGSNYYFVSCRAFEHMIARQQMAEWTEIYGNRYGTARQTIEREFERGCDLLFDIDERGARQLLKLYPALVTILVLPPSLDVLRTRLVERGTDDREVVQRRLKRAEEEVKSMSWYRYVIVNDRFDDALEKLKAIIIAERCRRTQDAAEAGSDETDDRQG